MSGNEKLYYLQDSRSLCGSNLMFWRKGGQGYGTNLDELEVYTLEEAQRHHKIRSSDIPLLKSLVDSKCINAVDCQYLPEDKQVDSNDEYVIQINKRWNGNDILFVGKTKVDNETYNLKNANVFKKEEIPAYFLNEENFTVFSKEAIEKVSRKTFQVNNIEDGIFLPEDVNNNNNDLSPTNSKP